jgi:hypothetical protein
VDGIGVVVARAPAAQTNTAAKAATLKDDILEFIYFVWTGSRYRMLRFLPLDSVNLSPGGVIGTGQLVHQPPAHGLFAVNNSGRRIASEADFKGESAWLGGCQPACFGG